MEGDISGYKRNENQLKDVERHNHSLTSEVERLNGLMKNQAGELNDYKIRYNKVEGTLSEYKSIEIKVRDY